MYLTYTLSYTSSSPQRNDLVERTVASLGQFVARLLHRQSDVDPGASGVGHQGILLLHQLQQLLAIHRLSRLALLGLTNAGVQDLCNVLLLHEVLVQLLNTLHLEVVKPVGSLRLSQFMKHLGIELLVVDVALVVDQFPSGISRQM